MRYTIIVVTPPKIEGAKPAYKPLKTEFVTDTPLFEGNLIVNRKEKVMWHVQAVLIPVKQKGLVYQKEGSIQVQVFEHPYNETH